MLAKDKKPPICGIFKGEIIMVEDFARGKYFSITDPKDMSTVIYQVNKTAKEFLKTSSKYNVERLDYTEEYVGDNKKKTFFVL